MISSEKLLFLSEKKKNDRTKQRVLLLNSHSLNNREIFELTWWNHSHYCEKYNYHMLNLIEPYSAKLDCSMMIHLLQQYDLVVCMGSDLLFTNPDIPLEQFAVTDITLARERTGSLNGDFILFRNTGAAFEILRFIEKIQRGMDTTQSAFNILQKAFPKNIKAVEGLQYADPEMNPEHKDSLWKPGDFAIHFHRYGEIPLNSSKAFYIREFIKKYGDFS